MSKLIDYDSNEWDDLNSFPPELWRQRAIYHEVRAETLTKQLQIAREKFQEIMDVSGTSCLHYKLAKQGLREIEGEK